VLTAHDWKRLAQALAGYQRKVGIAASTTRLRNPRLGDTFYDDNAWVGLAAVPLGAEDAAFRGLAEATYRFILRGWDKHRGGVYWKERPKESLHVCSTGPALVLAGRLYHIQPRAIDLTVVRKMMDWLQTMRDADGRYWDNERVRDGRVDRTLHTYNTGTPLEAMAVWQGVEGFDFRDLVETSLASLPKFLVDGSQLPKTPWFNVVLLRALLVVEATYQWSSPLLAVYRTEMNQALETFNQGAGVLHLPSRDDRGGIMLRDAAAAVETLAWLASDPI
jgi:hypothetical protein